MSQRILRNLVQETAQRFGYQPGWITAEGTRAVWASEDGIFSAVARSATDLRTLEIVRTTGGRTYEVAAQYGTQFGTGFGRAPLVIASRFKDGSLAWKVAARFSAEAKLGSLPVWVELRRNGAGKCATIEWRGA